ncbi:MAG: hypothetical protein U0Q22_13445 [Acidimicrobiales bacterium]
MTIPPSASRVVVRLLGVATMLMAMAPLGLGAPAASAQTTPPAVTPPAGIPDSAIATVNASLGIVAAGQYATLGWVAADGVVVTSDHAAKGVGDSATFGRAGEKSTVDCYVAVHRPEIHLSVMRCAGLRGPSLSIESKFPVPGQPVFAVSLTGDDLDSARQMSSGTVLENNVSFMGSTRLRLSFVVGGDKTSTVADAMTPLGVPGTPVFDADGKVISSLFVAPEGGGSPLGARPNELISAVNTALPLPASFSSAALIVAGRRALIPAAVGLVVGLIWGALTRNGTIISKALGLAALGVVGTVAFTIFTLLVAGPQTIIG